MLLNFLYAANMFFVKIGDWLDEYECSERIRDPLLKLGRGGRSTGVLWNVACTERLPLVGKEILSPSEPINSRLSGLLGTLCFVGVTLKLGISPS